LEATTSVTKAIGLRLKAPRLHDIWGDGFCRMRERSDRKSKCLDLQTAERCDAPLAGVAVARSCTSEIGSKLNDRLVEMAKCDKSPGTGCCICEVASSFMSCAGGRIAGEASVACEECIRTHTGLSPSGEGRDDDRRNIRHYGDKHMV
jgi:hypothetical protein